MINCFPINLIQRKALREIDYKHIGEYISLYYAKKVGFIFSASSIGMDKGIDILISTLKARGVIYKGICIDFRKKGEGVIRPFCASTKVTHLYKDDVNWYGKPKEDAIQEFLSEEYDIIIDLTPEKRIFTVDYILRLTKSSLMVGVSQFKGNIYDIVISGQQLPSEEATQEEIAQNNITHIRNIINYLVTIR